VHWHYCLGHLAFKKLQQLARHGKIPKRLANVQAPRCPSCLLSAMTKVPWRGKERKNKHTVFTATKLGKCVSVDYLQSTEPSYFGQLANTRYKNVTIFVNHYSRLQFVYLMTSNLTSLETSDAKQAFEQFSAMHGIKIQHYHCNNGQFVYNDFKSACKQSNQRLTLCGVNTHTFLRVHRSSSFVYASTGYRRSASNYGHMPFNMPPLAQYSPSP
jgi:hypothetical protein